MGSLGRKLKRKKEAEKRKLAAKQANKDLKGVTNKIESMPKVCGECGAEFDKTDKEMLNQWRIAVYDNGYFHLTCPDCGPSKEELEAMATKQDS
mgnify:CR=1 FL=1